MGLPDRLQHPNQPFHRWSYRCSRVVFLASRTRTFQAHELCGIQLLLVLRCNLRAYHPRWVDLPVLGRLHALTAAMQPSKELARGVFPPAGWYRLQTSIPGSVCQGLRVVAFSALNLHLLDPTRSCQRPCRTRPYQTPLDPTGPVVLLGEIITVP